MVLNRDEVVKEMVINAAKTTMSSKLIGVDSDFFADMVYDAMMAVKRSNSKVRVSVHESVEKKQKGRSAVRNVLC